MPSKAPISALDHSADVTDWYAFVSYDHPDRVTMILNVDGFLEPSNGPNYFPFDPNVRYVMNVDNSQSGKADIQFVFRFKTEIRQPGLFTGFVGGIAGILGGLAASGNRMAGGAVRGDREIAAALDLGEILRIGFRCRGRRSGDQQPRQCACRTPRRCLEAGVTHRPDVPDS